MVIATNAGKAQKMLPILLICCAMHSGAEILNSPMLPDETCVAFSPADSRGDAAFNMAIKHWRDGDGYLGGVWMMCAVKRGNGAAQELAVDFFNDRAWTVHRPNCGKNENNTCLLVHVASIRPYFGQEKSFLPCEIPADLLSFDDNDIRVTADGAIYANAMFYKSACCRNWLVHRAIVGERDAALQLADYYGLYCCDVYLGSLWYSYALLFERDCQDCWEMARLCADSGFDYMQHRWTNDCWKTTCNEWLQETQKWYANAPECSSVRARWGEWDNWISTHPWASEALENGDRPECQ